MNEESNCLPDPSPFMTRLMQAVAPEKSDVLQDRLVRFGIAFAVDQSEDRIFFTADSGERVITVGLKCLGRLWANSFAYFCIYTSVAEAKTNDPSIREMSLNENERLRQATELLRWATTADIGIKLHQRYGIEFAASETPTGLPIPFSGNEFASDEHVADELTLVAIGYTLHHERVHIELGHVRCEGADSFEQEKVADMRAAEWLLDSPDIQPNAMLKRQLGIAVALGWLASREVYVGKSGGNSHPPGYDRLFQVLDQYVEDDNDLIWAFVSVLLGVHLHNGQIELEMDQEFSSFKDCVNYYINEISKINE